MRPKFHELFAYFPTLCLPEFTKPELTFPPTPYSLEEMLGSGRLLLLDKTFVY